MSRVPYLVEGRWGFKLGNQPLIDAMYRDGFICPISKLIMGETAEIPAPSNTKFRATSRTRLRSKATGAPRRAAAECHFKAEIVPIEVKDKKGNVTRLEKDEHVRAGRDARSAREAAARIQQDRQRDRRKFQRHHRRRRGRGARERRKSPRAESEAYRAHRGRNDCGRRSARDGHRPRARGAQSDQAHRHESWKITTRSS